MTEQDQTEPGQAGPDRAEPPDDLPYETARDELIEVVRRLEAGGTSLEESLALWERGEKLAAICQRWLDGARARLAAATATEPATEPDGE
ncbi:MAG: exodeoxyribonuclease VII small subunit [Nocardioidaceae bacterium]